jgi:hypothetical protein
MFLQICSVGFKTCTNITATFLPEIMFEVTNKLPELHSCSQTPPKRSILYYFPLFLLAKKRDKTKGQICKTLSTKVQNLSKSSSSDKGKQAPYYLGTCVTFGAMLLLRFVLH